MRHVAPLLAAEFFEMVVASLGVGILVLDPDGRIVYANPATEALLGKLSVGTSFRSWISNLAGIAASDAELPPTRALREDAPEPFDVVVPCSGSRVNILSRPFRIGTGDRVGSVSVIRDVTAERHSEEELWRAQTFIDSIVENIPDMVFVKDAQHLRFERFNRAGEDLLGIPRGELLGKSDFDIFPQEQAEFFQNRDRETLREGRLVDIEEEPIDTKNGRRWLHTKKITIPDEQGNPKYLLGISSDITARRAAEEALKKAHDELEHRVAERTEELKHAEEQLRHVQKLEAIGRLAGGVAHDFNNVLAVIMGQVGYVMGRFPPGDPIQEDLRPIRAAAEHAAALTKQLLTFSRKHVMQPELTNLNRIVERSQEMLARLLGEDIELISRLSPSIGSVHVDAALVEQVIVNLAVNARDAMPHGGTLTIETEGIELSGRDRPSTLPEGRYALLQVKDTGTGMDAQTKTRAFEPFFTTKPPGRGTGLGLAVAYGVIAQSGGAIEVDSEPGRGACFRVYLPSVAGDRAQEPSTTRGTLVRGVGETVLIAEDEALLRRVLRAILEDAGYLVLDAANAPDAIAVAERHRGPIHLLVSDVVMPFMSGPDLANRLLSSRPKLRVLFMSGYAGEKLAERAFVEDSVNYLAKPFSPETLTTRVREVLEAG